MRRFVVIVIFILVASVVKGQTPTFTFQCVCDYLTAADSTCDICNTTTQSRFFKGLLIYKNGVAHKWIEQPYTIIQNFDALTFRELIPGAEQIRIELRGTAFDSIAQFRDSVLCPCAGGIGEIDIAVDTPIIGNGTIGNPITIGQFGADTTMFLNWNGVHWYPANVKQTWVTNDLPYYLNDGDAISSGWPVGKTYLLAQGNTLAMPVGMWKTVIGCGFDCANPIRFYASDAAATAAGIPPGQQYATSVTNIYGILYGFVRAVYAELDSDTLQCSSLLPEYIDDPDAIADGAAIGEHYTVTTSNPYGAPAGCERVVSTSSTTEGEAPDCCDIDATLPYYYDDAAAIAAGLSADNYYLLSVSNPYGWPRSTKKRI
jgi:hypothetical protein